MRMTGRLPPRLFWISPGRGLSDELLDTLRSCCNAGLTGFQLREKASVARALLATGGELRRIVPSEGLLMINDRLDLALAGAFDGVHLGAGSVPVDHARRLLGEAAWIGRSVHNDTELAEAVAGGADFVFASPVFPVCKAGVPATAPLGLAGLEGLVAASPMPVLGLGGITPENLDEVLGTGAHGVAVMRSIADSSDPHLLVQRYLERLS
ncbi:MAG: thiamine phosphate synthase [Planctomycetes bacterium]|nr:thiamine phosphate synthase [Planctomycetota bacterium]